MILSFTKDLICETEKNENDPTWIAERPQIMCSTNTGDYVLQQLLSHSVHNHTFTHVFTDTHAHTHLSVWALLENSADGVEVLADLRAAGQWLEVLQVPPSILLIVSHIVDDVRNHHGEPTEHGDEHGYIGGLVVKVAEVDPWVQHLDYRLARVLLLHRRVADHFVHRLGVEAQLPQDLLQRTLTVPRVVWEADFCPEPGERLFGDTLDAIVW